MNMKIKRQAYVWFSLKTRFFTSDDLLICDYFFFWLQIKDSKDAFLFQFTFFIFIVYDETHHDGQLYSTLLSWMFDDKSWL